MGDDNYTIRGFKIGGRNNTYGAEPKPPRVETDQSKETKQQPGGWYEHPPAGAISFAYSFTPYRTPSAYHYQYPPPPPYQYHYPPPPPYQYQYGGYGGPPPQMADGDHGYYGGYHKPGYPGQFPPPIQGGYNYGDAAATGAPVYGHGQNDTVNKQLGQDHNHGGAHMNKGLPASGAVVAGAAASGGHGDN